MAKRLEPKCKQCRREGEKLYLKGERCFTTKCGIVKRNFKPGVHGPTSRTRPTPFGTQLREKQKARNTYGLMERQFRGYFEKASGMQGNTGEILVRKLETRLDNVVYRLGFGKSRALARQLVSHGHVLVNGHRVTIASYQVQPGDVVSLAKGVLKSKLLENDAQRMEKHQAPGWLHVDLAEHSGKVVSLPEGEDLKQGFDPRLIVEFYSR